MSAYRDSIVKKALRARTVALAASIAALGASHSNAAFTTFESSGANAAAITPTRDAFRTAVGGGTTAGANGSFGGLRREINWDGVPDAKADPNFMPADFFNTTSPRGAVFSTPGTGFMVSANSGLTTPTLFGFGNDFAAFSPQRIFTAVKSNITDVSFFVPGTNTPATTSAFGVVFTDVETAGGTKVQFFDQNNTMIYSRDAMTASNQGFSFVGAVAGAGEQISRVEITSGVNTIQSDGVLGNPTDDIVAMDDFLFAEPAAAVPEPASAAMALGLLGFCGARFRRSDVASKRSMLP
jgi:hypothetical protein